MQDEQKDYTPPAEEDSTDISSTYKSTIHNDDSDDDISESDNSLQEEAVLPEADQRLASLVHDLGYTKIYEVEQGLNGNAGTKMAIPIVALYFERGKELQHLNMIEYGCLIQIEKKKNENDDNANDCLVDDHEALDGLPQLNTKKRGRQSSSRFEYNTNFEMQRLFQQQTASKEPLPFVIGHAPPQRPGNKPLRLNEESISDYEKRLNSWQRQANVFARYYLLLFRPTSIKDVKKNDFTFEGLQNWIAECRASNTWFNKSRLAMFNSRLNGMSISSTNKKLITAYCGRCRTIWTSEERYDNDEYFASQHAQWTENSEASELTSLEYNLEHSDLGNAINNRMKKQEHDISNIQIALESLLPSSSGGHNRYDRITADERTRPLLRLPSSHFQYTSIPSHRTIPGINRVGQQLAKELRVDLDAAAMERIYSGDNVDLNAHVAPVGNGGLNGVTSTEVEPGTDPTNSKTHELEPDQAVVFDEIMHLMLQGNGCQETKPMLVLGPTGTGKTHLIFAILDAARSKNKEFICTSFNAITATAIGGDTFSGDCFWRPELHQRHPSPFKPDELVKFLNNHGFGVKFAERDFNDVVVGIIIEEVSTFSPEMLCHLDIRLRQLTKVDKPFGGLIVLMVGDFGQLGPVEASSIPSAVVNLCQFISQRDKSILIRNEIARENKIRNRKKKNQNRKQPCRAKSCLPSATKEFEHRYSEGHPYRKGIELFTSARLFHLTTQKRAQDSIHRNHIESMFRGEKLTFQMFNQYEELKAIDIEKGGDFCDAPILCSTNRERHTINGIMAPIRASEKGVCAIRWNADLNAYWDQKPSDQYISQIMYRDSCFWEYFVPGSDGYLTDNLCKVLKLVNGTHIRYHSLSFDTHEKQVQFEELVANAKVGEVLSLPLGLRPEAINVELIDLSEATKQKWMRRHLSLFPDKVVIPLPCQRKFSKIPKSIIVPGAPDGTYKCSKIRVRNFFPVEPGFAITIYKAQGRTIPKVILAISERQGDGCGLNYRAIYVAFSRVKLKNDIRLLLFSDDGTRASLTYLTKLTADPCNLALIDGFDKHGGKFNVEKVLDKYAKLTGSNRSGNNKKCH